MADILDFAAGYVDFNLGYNDPKAGAMEHRGAVLRQHGDRGMCGKSMPASARQRSAGLCGPLHSFRSECSILARLPIIENLARAFWRHSSRRLHLRAGIMCQPVVGKPPQFFAIAVFIAVTSISKNQ